jgi:hypothetical protein
LVLQQAVRDRSGDALNHPFTPRVSASSLLQGLRALYAGPEAFSRDRPAYIIPRKTVAAGLCLQEYCPTLECDAAFRDQSAR